MRTHLIYSAAIASLCMLTATAQTQKSEQPPPVSGVQALPPPPALEPPAAPPPSQDDVPAPPPPPPQVRHFDIPMLAPANGGGVYSDFALPAGRISGIRWVAVGPGNIDVTAGIDVTVMSPAMFVRAAPSGGTELFINQGGGAVRAIARKTKPMAAARITLSIDVEQP